MCKSIIVFSITVWRRARSTATSALAIGHVVASPEVHLRVCYAWEYCSSLFVLSSIFIIRDHLQIMELFKSFVRSIVDQIIDYVYVKTILCLVKRLNILIIILEDVLDGFLEEVAH